LHDKHTVFHLIQSHFPQQQATRGKRDASVAKKEPAREAADRKPSKTREPAPSKTAAAASKSKAPPDAKSSRKEPVISGSQNKKAASKVSSESKAPRGAGIDVRLSRKVNAPEVAPKNLASRTRAKDVIGQSRTGAAKDSKVRSQTKTRRETDEEKLDKRPAHEVIKI